MNDVQVIELKKSILEDNDAEIFRVSAKTGEGIDVFLDWIRGQADRLPR